MITDKFMRVSTAQAVSATAVSTDSVDLSIARDMGEGEELFAVFSVGVAGTGAGTITFDVIAADDAALTSNIVRLGSSDPYVGSSLALGTNVAVRVNPRIASKGAQYLGVRYTVASTATATVTADFVVDIQDGRKFYASGFTVV